MVRVNLLDCGGRIARLERACERITKRLNRPELVAAVAEMRREWPAAEPCDHCASPAFFVWERTGADIKRIERTKKLRGSALPVSRRCVVHVPHAFPELGENYRDARVARVSSPVAA